MKKERMDQLKKKGKDRQDYQPDTTGIKKLSVNFDTIKRVSIFVLIIFLVLPNCVYVCVGVGMRGS